MHLCNHVNFHILIFILLRPTKRPATGNFDVAGHPGKQQELAEMLLGYIQNINLSSRTWFEHILTQPHLASRTPVNYGYELLRRYHVKEPRFELHDLGTYSVAERFMIGCCRINRTILWFS